MVAQYGRIWLIVCPLVFLAGFVDAVAGGGGLISLPAYLMAGLPAHLALGTNKFAMSLGTLTAAVRYGLAGKMRLRPSVFAACGAVLGAPLGTLLALRIPARVLSGVLLVLLPCVAVFLALRPEIGRAEGVDKGLSPLRTAVLSLMIGLAVGAYDGLIGPGTGTFLILAFTAVLGYDLLLSSGCAKAVNLASNLSSLAVFALNGKVLLPVGLPAAVCAIAGNQLGAALAVRGGAKFVRALIFAVLGLLIVKTVWGFFAG